MNENYRDYLMGVLVKARGGRPLSRHQAEEDLYFNLLDSFFKYGLTPFKDIQARAGETIAFRDWLRFLIDNTDDTNELRFYRSKEVYLHTGHAYTLFGRLFSKLMIDDRPCVEALMDMKSGPEFLALLGYDPLRGFSLERMASQSKEEITELVDLIFGLIAQEGDQLLPSPAYEEFAYAPFIVANSILVAQKLIEDGESIHDVHRIFAQRNAYLLISFRMHQDEAVEYGRYLANAMLFPYESSQWPKGVCHADLLGLADAGLNRTPNYKASFTWQHAPLQGVINNVLSELVMECEDRFNRSPLFRRYMKGLCAETLEDKHMMTNGMAALIDQFRGSEVADYTERTTVLLQKRMETDAHFDLFSRFITDVLGHQVPSSYSLGVCYLHRIATDIEPDDYQYLLENLQSCTGEEFFTDISREYIKMAYNPEFLTALLPLLPTMQEMAHEVSSPVRRLMIETELGV